MADIIETTTTTITTEYPLPTTTDYPLYADFIAAPASSMSSAAVEELIGHAPNNQITFEIPTAHDLKHIDALHTFNTLLKRIGNMAYDTVGQTNAHMAAAAAGQNTITTEQIAKSVVLDLADLNEDTTATTTAENLMERLFGGADMHEVINYLWIGVVSALVVLSLIFILFSCYFYRKFREWKKCNKDIRSQLNAADLYGAALATTSINASNHNAAHLSLLNANGQATEAATFYQIESPPCYTIATGLPTYDEALHHHHHEHFSYGMKFMYPSIAAVHHHQHQHHQQQQQVYPAIASAAVAERLAISNWEKQELMQQQRFVEKQQQQLLQEKPKQSASEFAPPTYVALQQQQQQLLACNVASNLKLQSATTTTVCIDMSAAESASIKSTTTEAACSEVVIA